MSSARHFSAQHVRVSSTDDLSYSFAPKGEISDTIQTIVTGRKCWKTMKGKGEVVWPPYLEAALVEGLEKYQPVESRTSRAPGRFPMRNKFISDYIYNTTGKRRTPKQVGSRLQQLRDTTEGKRILQLLSNRHTAMMSAPKSPSSSSPPSSCRPGPSPSSSPALAPAPPAAPPVSYVTIEVLPPNSPADALAGLSLAALPPVPAPSTQAYRSPGPRALRAIDPTVTFLARAPVTAHAAFRVLRAGQAVHEERAELRMCGTSCTPQARPFAEMECTFLYKTRLVPAFWAVLCESRDPTQYTVVQDIVRTAPSATLASTSAAGAAGAQEETLLSVVYQFANPFATPPLSPTSSGSGSGSAGAEAFSAESSPDLSPDFDHLMFGAHTQQHAQHPAQQQGHAHAHPGDDAYASVPPSPLDVAPFGALAQAHAAPAAAWAPAGQSQGQGQARMYDAYEGASYGFVGASFSAAV
ncbi:hypothetical protein CERSUDRAFT_118346 [Gelatoporia subvermispora B]|uniref:TEA domain-containing protein n=1 Tax=Ceriporiopsis subvermispora (strain B) TaxID=914234 RepID=M2PBH4_CERS8|nr:hypothetical protein CERSUDRAFT_118346 [Gelatoporia subvermispora B]